MPHALFPTAFGTCGLAWNDAGLTGFQLPEASDALTEQHLAVKGRSVLATEPVPDWVQQVIVRVQQHLAGNMQDFADTRLDWARVSDFQQAVYRHALEIRPGYKKSYGEIAKLMALGDPLANVGFLGGRVPHIAVASAVG